MDCKTCFKCGVSKPLHDFYKNKGMADGRVNKCKECNKIDVKKNYRKNIDHYKEYDRGRAMLPHRVEARKAYQKTDAGKESKKKAVSKWRKNNPIKKSASIMVNNAVRDGRLIKLDECESCGSKNRIHGHHCDYSKPLEVMWLCPKCHNDWHRKNGEGKNG